MDATLIAAVVIFIAPLVVIVFLYFLRKRMERTGDKSGQS